jgi:hypothetical protein
MKLPFFSLQAGSINIVQPCNNPHTPHEGRLMYRHGYELYSNQYPEYSNCQLFLNGSHAHKSYNIIKIPANKIERIVDLLKHYNEVN